MADEMIPASMPPSDDNTPATRADVRSLNSKVNMLSVGIVGGALLGTLISVFR